MTVGVVRPSLLDRALFQEVPATPLAVLRIATGLVAVVWCALWLSDSFGWLGQIRSIPDGIIGWWHPWPDAPQGAVQAMGVLLLVSAIGLTLGLFTKFSAWSAFLLMLMLQRYLIGSYNYGDLILRTVLLLGLALGPSGAYLSVDAWRKGWSWRAPLVSIWSLRFVQLHISLGYVLTVALKLMGDHWIDGTAIWYALQLEDLMRVEAPDLLISFPIGAVLTWMTLAVELFVALGVWFRKTRAIAVAAGVALHLSIFLAMDIGLFSIVMIVSYLAWLPPVSDVRVLLPGRTTARV